MKNQTDLIRLNECHMQHSLFQFFCLQEVEFATKILLAKGGESNHFIREDVDKALCSMIENVTPQRALLGLINGGAK